MPLTSPIDPVDIPKTDVLTYLFPPGSSPSEDPIWLESADPENSLSPKQLLNWVKRLAIGLDRKGIQAQEAALILTPNHIFVPAAYLGIVGSRRIFSAANPIYTVHGECSIFTCLVGWHWLTIPTRIIPSAQKYRCKNHTRSSESTGHCHSCSQELWTAQGPYLPIFKPPKRSIERSCRLERVDWNL
jgi:hypothetical protein